MAQTLANRRFLDPAVLARIGNLAIDARRPMLGSVAGRHRSPHRGSSVEFAEYRKYVPGDDLRRLDWRAYGRSDRFYVKEFEADTNLRLCLVVDASGSMRYGPAGNTKYEYAARLAASLSFLALRQGDAAGLTIASEDDVRYLPARRKASHLAAIHDVLEAAQPKGAIGLPQTLHDLAERVHQRALVVIVSDLFCPPAELREALLHLYFKKHDVVCFQLYERAEIDFHFDRTTRFVDLEGGASIVADPTTIGRRYRAALERYREELAEAVRAARVDHQVVLLDEPLEETISRWLVARVRKKARR